MNINLIIKIKSNFGFLIYDVTLLFFSNLSLRISTLISFQWESDFPGRYVQWVYQFYLLLFLFCVKSHPFLFMSVFTSSQKLPIGQLILQLIESSGLWLNLVIKKLTYVSTRTWYHWMKIWALSETRAEIVLKKFARN